MVRNRIIEFVNKLNIMIKIGDKVCIEFTDGSKPTGE
jgi:hypothetical protein